MVPIRLALSQTLNVLAVGIETDRNIPSTYSDTPSTPTSREKPNSAVTAVKADEKIEDPNAAVNVTNPRIADTPSFFANGQFCVMSTCCDESSAVLPVHVMGHQGRRTQPRTPHGRATMVEMACLHQNWA